MRSALALVFEQPATEHPNFVIGKLRDLLSLVVIGVVLLVSVALAGFVTGFSDYVLDWIGLDSELDWLVQLIGRAIGFAANLVLFFTLFKLLARPHAPNRSLWSGALLGAIGFEVLKAASFLLLSGARGSPPSRCSGSR